MRVPVRSLSTGPPPTADISPPLCTGKTRINMTLLEFSATMQKPLENYHSRHPHIVEK